MAASIASPKNTSHRMSCILMEKLKTLKKVSLCCVSFQFVFYDAILKKGKPNKKKQKRKTEGLESAVFGRDPGLLIYNSQFITVQIDTDYRHMICLGFAPVHIEFFFYVLYFFFIPPSTDGSHDMVLLWVGWLVYCGITLHGLPTKQISGQQGVNGGGAPNHTCVFSTWWSPQAGVLGHPAPQQVSLAGLSSATTTAPLANRVGLRCPAHPVLIGSRVGLPASGVCP